MKRTSIFILSLLTLIIAQAEPQTMRLFDAVTFYDGYNGTVMDADLQDGILRHRNSLYALKLTDEQCEWFKSKTTMNITVGALCDNYDRIGNINLALVPKGAETYDPFEVKRLELGRFITPFMDKNKEPDEVPYSFDIDYIGYIFHDARYRADYDYWIEFELFGVPYAANEQIAGCAGRNDVFTGTLDFVTDGEDIATDDNDVLVPIVMKKPEYISHNLNNYNENATDTIGTTTKTYKFTVPENVADGHIVYIISNHGANSGGEEYNRRKHLLYFDGELQFTYIPGGVSCEPYRVYNTQANGIYGNKRTEKWWQKNSNWCPGAVIPIRYLELGALEAGEHSVMVRVPTAKFVSQQGDFPVSIYFQGLKEGKLPTFIENVLDDHEYITLDRHGNVITFKTDRYIDQVQLISVDGRMMLDTVTRCGDIDLTPYPAGAYILCLYTLDGYVETHKVVR